MKVHLKAGGGTTRCGRPPRPFPRGGESVATEEAGVTCRMCLRCKDTDAGLRYTR